MYSNAYGYNIYKRGQINMGNPYEVKHPANEAAKKELASAQEEGAAGSEFELIDFKSAQYIEKAREEARSEARLILEEAELEAQRYMDEAYAKALQEAESLAQKASEEGFAHGEEMARQQYQEILEEAESYKERCKSEYEATLAAMEKDILSLVTEIAGKVIGHMVQNHEETIVGIVSETLNASTELEHVVIKVSSEDYAYLSSHEGDIRARVRDLNQLEIKQDSTLEKGSCVIDTGIGIMDGSASTRLALIKEAFFEVLGEKDQHG